MNMLKNSSDSNVSIMVDARGFTIVPQVDLGGNCSEHTEVSTTSSTHCALPHETQHSCVTQQEPNKRNHDSIEQHHAVYRVLHTRSTSNSNNSSTLTPQRQ